MPYQVTYAEPCGTVVTRNVAGRVAVNAFIHLLQQEGCRIIQVVDFEGESRVEANDDRQHLHARPGARLQSLPLARAA